MTYVLTIFSLSDGFDYVTLLFVLKSKTNTIQIIGVSFSNLGKTTPPSVTFNDYKRMSLKQYYPHIKIF